MITPPVIISREAKQFPPSANKPALPRELTKLDGQLAIVIAVQVNAEGSLMLDQCSGTGGLEFSR